MKFLLECDRGWIGSEFFYSTLNRLGINPILYALPTGYIFQPDELQYYLDSIENDLRGKDKDKDYIYIKERCLALRRWADDGLLVHVR